MKKVSKIVVFDLDETLGHFTELGMFWDTIQQHFHHDLGQESFNKICDLYPEFFRPHIFVILKFESSSMYLFTVAIFLSQLR